MAARLRLDLANLILIYCCLHASGCGGSPNGVAAPSQIDLATQRSVSEFGISPDASPFELLAFDIAPKIELKLPSTKTIELEVESAVLRRDAASDRVQTFQFSLPKMTAVQAARRAKEIVSEVTILDSTVASQIDTWQIAAEEMPPLHAMGISPPSIPKLHLNGLGERPHCTISFYLAFDDAKTWYLAVQFTWDNPLPQTLTD